MDVCFFSRNQSCLIACQADHQPHIGGWWETWEKGKQGHWVDTSGSK